MAANATRTEIFDVTPEQFYNVLIDYSSYPDFVEGVNGVEVLEQNAKGARVEFTLNLIKKFRYILKLTHTKNKSVSWELDSGDIFKSNKGSWQLKELADGKTEVTYSVELEIKGFVPKTIVNTLTQKNLPSMMQAYADRAQE